MGRQPQLIPSYIVYFLGFFFLLMDRNEKVNATVPPKKYVKVWSTVVTSFCL